MARSLTDTLDRLAASGKLDKFSGGKQADTDGVQRIDLSDIEADPDQRGALGYNRTKQKGRKCLN